MPYRRNSPEHVFVVRQLIGLRYSREEAGGSLRISIPWDGQLCASAER